MGAYKIVAYIWVGTLAIIMGMVAWSVVYKPKDTSARQTRG